VHRAFKCFVCVSVYDIHVLETEQGIGRKSRKEGKDLIIVEERSSQSKEGEGISKGWTDIFCRKMLWMYLSEVS
jgi:hypothetical protein